MKLISSITLTPETYTRLYDEVVTAMKKVQPHTKFVGLALAMETRSALFRIFPRSQEPQAGSAAGFHLVSLLCNATADQTPEIEQFTYFDQADGFLKSVRYIESIRKRLSPETKTTIDEIGVISADDVVQNEPGHVTKPIENSYWNLACAMYAYIFGEMTKMGIDVAGRVTTGGLSHAIP